MALARARAYFVVIKFRPSIAIRGNNKVARWPQLGHGRALQV